jgi:hypothetical protein
MVEVMILRDFTRFTVLIVCVMLPIAVGLTWRFDSSGSYDNLAITWWTFMSIFVDAGSSPLICILLELILLRTALCLGFITK